MTSLSIALSWEIYQHPIHPCPQARLSEMVEPSRLDEKPTPDQNGPLTSTSSSVRPPPGYHTPASPLPTPTSVASTLTAGGRGQPRGAVPTDTTGPFHLDPASLAARSAPGKRPVIPRGRRLETHDMELFEGVSTYAHGTLIPSPVSCDQTPFGASAGSPEGQVDGKLSKTLDDILDTHFEHLDRSLQELLTREQT